MPHSLSSADKYGIPLLFCYLVLISSNTLASVKQIYILPDLSGLNIAYYYKKNSASMTLYAFNHEDHSVICDSQYRSGPEKKEQPQKIMASGEGAAFRFRFGRSAEKARIFLKCIPVPAEPDSTETINEDTSAANIESPKYQVEAETDSSTINTPE